jgi:hypothetical protein
MHHAEFGSNRRCGIFNPLFSCLASFEALDDFVQEKSYNQSFSLPRQGFLMVFDTYFVSVEFRLYKLMPFFPAVRNVGLFKSAIKERHRRQVISSFDSATAVFFQYSKHYYYCLARTSRKFYALLRSSVMTKCRFRPIGVFEIGNDVISPYGATVVFYLQSTGIYHP